MYSDTKLLDFHRGISGDFPSMTGNKNHWDFPMDKKGEFTQIDDHSERENNRWYGNRISVPSKILWIFAALVCGLIMSNVSLWVTVLHSQVNVNVDKDAAFNFAESKQASVLKAENGQETLERKERSTGTTSHLTIEQALEMEERMIHKVEGQHLSAHLVPSASYGSLYTVTSLAPISWVSHLTHTHNDIFENDGPKLKVLTSGYYSVSVNVMFNGRDQSSTWRRTSMCTLKVRVTRGEHGTRTFMIASVTQDEGGRPISSVGEEQYPFDTAHASGVFKFYQNDQIFVVPDSWTPGCRISVHKPKTHFDAFFLRPIHD